MDPTRRVQQLLTLAADPAASEEEARTAALQAARGIRQHGLVVTTPEEAQIRRGGTYASQAVTPRGRHLGPGTPQLPARARSRGTGRGVDPLDAREGAHVVELDFRDDVHEKKPEPAFSPALLALLRRS